MSLIFVDCEAIGKCPGLGELTEFGAVEHDSKESFHGILKGKTPEQIKEIFSDFEKWVLKFGERPVFVSDNPAFDWQWINYYFHHNLGRNPFGHSARRISDFYAGLVNNWSETQKWKRLRITPHDHNPVHDAMGNLEAFDRLLRGAR